VNANAAGGEVGDVRYIFVAGIHGVDVGLSHAAAVLDGFGLDSWRRRQGADAGDQRLACAACRGDLVEEDHDQRRIGRGVGLDFGDFAGDGGTFFDQSVVAVFQIVGDLGLDGVTGLGSGGVQVGGEFGDDALPWWRGEGGGLRQRWNREGQECE
jgi:hypothetical protein